MTPARGGGSVKGVRVSQVVTPGSAVMIMTPGYSRPPLAGCSNQDADSFCNICWTETLGEAPCIQLGCGHVFHNDCIQTQLRKAWPGRRISFQYANCPLCDNEMRHNLLRNEIRQVDKLKADIIRRGRRRIKFEGGKEANRGGGRREEGRRRAEKEMKREG